MAATCEYCDLEMNGSACTDTECRDCGTPRGGLHHPGCDDERCPKCVAEGLRRLDGAWPQAISCGCGDEDEV